MNDVFSFSSLHCYFYYIDAPVVYIKWGRNTMSDSRMMLLKKSTLNKYPLVMYSKEKLNNNSDIHLSKVIKKVLKIITKHIAYARNVLKHDTIKPSGAVICCGMQKKTHEYEVKHHVSSQQLVTAVFEAIHLFLDARAVSAFGESRYFLLPSYSNHIYNLVEEMRRAFYRFREIILELDLTLSAELFKIAEWRNLYKAVNAVQLYYNTYYSSENELIYVIQETYISYCHTAQ